MEALNIEKRQMIALLKKYPCIDYDGYQVDIIDTQGFCDMMKAYGEKAGKPMITWTAETAKHFDNFLDVFGDTISDSLYNDCDNKLSQCLDSLTATVKSIL